MRKPFKMFTAGPVNVSPAVKQSLIYPEIGHRESEFSELYAQVRDRLTKVFDVSISGYSPVVINGSGTSAMETVISSTTHKGKSMLVINNGAFGDKIAEIAETYNIPFTATNYEWGEYPNLPNIERLLINDPKIETVSMVFMETSTGMVNPVNDVGNLCKKYDKTFIVDAISGLAVDPLDIKESNIDFCFSNTNKGLSGLPVISFALAKRSAIEKIKDIKPRNYSLNFLKYHKYAENGNETPFTPQIPLFYMLNQTLDELLEEGVENRQKRYKENSSLMRNRLKQLGFRFQLPEMHMSNGMTNVLIPTNYKYEEFHTRLKEKGSIIYPGKGPLENIIMHIANVGTHTKKEINEFCDAFAEIVKEKKPEY
ncbi:MAG: alanine--glyoxylate aminotransferase family protein [Nanoarchaeota archaeon]